MPDIRKILEKIDDFSQPFYVCGPPDFMESINAALEELGADPENLVFERWSVFRKKTHNTHSKQRILRR